MSETHNKEPGDEMKPESPSKTNTLDSQPFELSEFELAEFGRVSAALKAAEEQANEPESDIIRLWGGERVWSVWVCYAAFVILLLLAPLNGVRSTQIYKMAEVYWMDKLVHMGLFSVFTGLSGCAMFPFCRTPSLTLQHISAGRVALLVSIIATLGVSLEFLQPHFGRSFEWLDMAANLAAIIPGFGVFLILNEIRHFIVDRRM